MRESCVTPNFSQSLLLAVNLGIIIDSALETNLVLEIEPGQELSMASTLSPILFICTLYYLTLNKTYSFNVSLNIEYQTFGQIKHKVD